MNKIVTRIGNRKCSKRTFLHCFFCFYYFYFIITFIILRILFQPISSHFSPDTQEILRSLLAPAPPRLPEPDARLALAALLVRIAKTDGLYAAEEVERIDQILMTRHHIGPFDAAKLRTEAEDLETQAPDTVRFTRALKAAVPLEDRAGLMQALWSVALADGLRDQSEDQQMRLLANLLGLTDVESALARQQAERG